MKKFSIILIFIIIFSLLTSCTNNNDIAKEPEILYMHGTKVINAKNMNEMIGLADYVFIAKVNDFVETKYMFETTIESENGNITLSSPISVYSINVIDNIKGKLKKNEPIEIYKDGGLTEDGKMILLYENDFLPEKDNYYIFFASAQKDGWIGISGEYTNILINSSDEKTIKSSDEYKSVIEALQNEVEFDRKRYKSKYDE